LDLRQDARHREKQGIAIVPSLLFHVNMLPDYLRAKTARDERIVDLLNPRRPFPTTVRSPISPRLCRAIKTIRRVLIWEIGNEYNLEADLSAQWKKRRAHQISDLDPNSAAFLVQIASLIKKLDKNHLSLRARRYAPPMLAYPAGDAGAQGKPDPNRTGRWTGAKLPLQYEEIAPLKLQSAGPST